jgi:hypothetical protein
MKNPGCTFIHSMFTHKVCEKKSFCITDVKKIKTCHVKIYFESPKIVFFHTAHKKYFFGKLSMNIEC